MTIRITCDNPNCTAGPDGKPAATDANMHPSGRRLLPLPNWEHAILPDENHVRDIRWFCCPGCKAAVLAARAAAKKE